MESILCGSNHGFDRNLRSHGEGPTTGFRIRVGSYYVRGETDVAPRPFNHTLGSNRNSWNFQRRRPRLAKRVLQTERRRPSAPSLTFRPFKRTLVQAPRPR